MENHGRLRRPAQIRSELPPSTLDTVAPKMRKVPLSIRLRRRTASEPPSTLLRRCLDGVGWFSPVCGVPAPAARMGQPTSVLGLLDLILPPILLHLPPQGRDRCNE